MWFLFGVVTLSLMMWATFKLRRTSSWTGEQCQYKTAEGNSRWYTFKEQSHKGTKIGYRIGIPAQLGFEFQLRTETGLDATGKSFGITAEQSAGDSRFDAEVFIDSDDLRVGAALRRSQEARNAVLSLFRICGAQQASLNRVQAYRGRLWVDVKDKNGMPTRGVANDIANALYTLNEALAAEAKGLHRTPDPFLRRAMLILAVSTGLAIFGLVALFRLPASRLDLDTGFLWTVSAAVGILLCLAGSVLALKWLRASSRSFRVLVELLTVGMMGSILSVHAFAAEINREFDFGQPTLFDDVPARAYSETYRCGKRGRRTCTRYQIAFEGAWPGAGRELQIDLGLYNRLERTSLVDIEMMPGAVGCRWIRSIKASGPERQ